VSVTASAPAKINLALIVGPKRADGFHHLATIYQAVNLIDEVTVDHATAGSGISVTLSGTEIDGVPLTKENLAARAALAVARAAGRPADFTIAIRKEIPVAGGMAGGSADAAAALVATDALLESELGRDELMKLAATLGSDVPFALVGAHAVGTGRGEVVVPTLARGELHWVVALADGGLSTPAVFASLDNLRENVDVPPPVVPAALSTALVSGDVDAIAAALHNDMQPAALALMPALQRTLDAGRDAGALAGLVSGSGPTTLFLARDADHALDVAVRLSGAGVCRSVRRTAGPVPGARIVSVHS
jgi:4-diphosphocytidyl-2-C-methyl-D-erythritol kinase